MSIVSNYYNTTISEENVTVDFPNKELFDIRDQNRFWIQAILNQFAFYDWKSCDKAKISLLKKIMDEDFLIKEKLNNLRMLKGTHSGISEIQFLEKRKFEIQ